MKRLRGGFTLVEMLVVISIIGLLIALSLPAIQAVRENARATQCKNHLKQLGLAAQIHVEQRRVFPTNGWGFRWVGDPDRGAGLDQPGGWVFNILPYIEQENLHQLAFRQPPSQKMAAMQQMMETPVPLLYCPSRRSPSLGTYLGQFPLHNAPMLPQTAKCDYAGNGGDEAMQNIPGPDSTDPAVVRSYAWPNPLSYTGIFYPRSITSPADVRDGMSNTYLIGEKNVRMDVASITDPRERDIGDDQVAYVGDDTDIRRFTHSPPLPDQFGQEAALVFGSSHRRACHFVFCDGAVHAISFDIDPEVHKRLGNRRDGKPVGEF
ncbi:MAG: prepilin-type N-terminal cleavage/methylation domain-containing protein [Pirellulaceae bacterium]|nr:MAG: prepilin-type N-terminal cleavage/methylation domain-containing protein [Pirellulaceae bacterium]